MVVGSSWSLNLWVLGIVFPEVQVAKVSSLSFAFVYCQGLESTGVTLCSQCTHVPLFLCCYAQEATMFINDLYVTF
jgi:hypothetical protein